MEKKKRLDMGKSIIRFSNHSKGIVQTPSHLTPMQFSRYPADNAITFERWYLNSWTSANEQERVYLPIQWTALYCNNGYGNGPIIHTVQKFLDDLPTDKKYYTIVQYDDGILNNISHLDIEVCAMAGPRIDFSLPLLCTPHKFNFDQAAIKKKYIASFIGNYTHSMRASMIEQLKDKPGYYVTTKHHDLREYCEVLAQSKYVLCPRGYGQSSFRIQEAIDFGSIPVYISDEFIFPYNMADFPFGVCIDANPYDSLDIEGSINQAEAEGMDKNILDYIKSNKNLFTYAGCKQQILIHLKNESPRANETDNNRV
jgi:hypothetical protein